MNEVLHNFISKYSDKYSDANPDFRLVFLVKIFQLFHGA
jgi:hypothetical protein